METRKFGRKDWNVSEIGYGMWGMGGQWGGADDKAAAEALDLAVELGCNFFDTAWAYAEGHSEQLLGRLLKRHSDKKLYTATKVPPKNLKWPSKPSYQLDEVFPEKHIIEYTEKSLRNLNVETIDLIQFHVWEDRWADKDEWKEALEKLKKSGKIQAVGISINRWEPENSLNTIKTGLIDSVQVIYNIFDQSPVDKLFPLCKEKQVAVIARVPFDEGVLIGTMSKDTVFDEGDWRKTYFVPENLLPSLERVENLKPLVPKNATMAEMALRFILSHEAVTTTIPGMRKLKNVKANMSVSDGKVLENELLQKLYTYRWDRMPTWWSQ